MESSSSRTNRFVIKATWRVGADGAIELDVCPRAARTYYGQFSGMKVVVKNGTPYFINGVGSGASLEPSSKNDVLEGSDRASKLCK